MIVSAVVDPSAFGPASIADKLNRREAISLLRGVLTNGVLLDEPTKELLRESLAEAAKLSTKEGQHIQLLLAEIRKQHKKFVITCDRMSWQRQSPSTIPEKCAAVANALKADLVVTQPGHLIELRTSVGESVEVCLLEDASQSDYESLRIRLVQLQQPLDQLESTELEEYVGRSVKYASTVRFFDYLMLSTPHRYLSGIRFFADIWARWCIVGEPSSRTIELYTVANRQGARGGFLDGEAADSLIESSIRAPLSEATGVRVERHIKEDSEPRIFHTRGFEARHRAYTIDPGFDAISADGAIRRCLLKSDVAAESHFSECRKLNDATG